MFFLHEGKKGMVGKLGVVLEKVKRASNVDRASL